MLFVCFLLCGDRVKLQIEYRKEQCSAVAGKKPNLKCFLNRK